MGLMTWLETASKYRKTLILTALVTTFAGVGLVIDRPKGTVLEWLAIPFLLLGGGLFTWLVWPSTSAPSEASVSLAARLLRRVTFDGRLIRLFPVIGLLLIVLDVFYNVALSASPSFQTEDTIVVLAAATLLGYGLVPARAARERDFVLLFFVFLNVILVIPLLLARLYYADFEKSVDLYSWVALAPQTSAVLNLMGVRNQVGVVVGSTAPGLTFTPEHLSLPVTVVITTACSGIYSFGIFAAAFIAFVLTEYRTLTRRIWLLLGLGLFAAYAANVLRMTVIILVGYYTDTPRTDLQNMLIAHSYAGWLIFLGWIAAFWGILFKFLRVEPQSPTVGAAKPGTRKAEPLCGICSDPLTPLVPATRCVCGAFFHKGCLTDNGHCPNCGRLALSEPSRSAGTA